MKQKLNKTMIHYLDIHLGKDWIQTAHNFRMTFALSMEEASDCVAEWQKLKPINSTKSKNVELVDSK